MPPCDPAADPLRAVAPLIATADSRLLGAVLLVENGDHVIGVTCAELLRPAHGEALAIVTRLDGSATIPVASWGMGRYSGLGLVEIDVDVPRDHDLEPLSIGAVRATPETRGAPARIVTIVPDGDGFRRELVPVHVDEDDGGGMHETVTRLASPVDPAHADRAFVGAPVFVWFPPDPALGRPSEVLAVAIVQPHFTHTGKPRETPIVGELVGLDDLGRALIDDPEPDERPELAQVAGEIDDQLPPEGAGAKP